MTNPKRGEMSLEIGEKQFKVKITMDTLMRIETAIGKGILKVAQGLSVGEMSATEMVAILTPILRSGGKDLKEKDVANIIWEAGFAEGLKAVAEVIAFVIGGNEGNEAEAEIA